MSEVSPDAQDFALWLSGYADAVPGAIPAEVCDRLAVVIGALVARRLRAPSISNPFDRDVTEQTFGPLADKKLHQPFVHALPRSSSTSAMAAESARLVEAEMEQKVASMNRDLAKHHSPVAYAT